MKKFLMILSLCAVGFAVHAADTDASPPDRAKVGAAMKTCAESANVTKGTRPTREQHEKIEACMSAAGFEKPKGHHGPPPDGGPNEDGGRPPGPPPEN